MSHLVRCILKTFTSTHVVTKTLTRAARVSSEMIEPA